MCPLLNLIRYNARPRSFLAVFLSEKQVSRRDPKQMNDKLDISI